MISQPSSRFQALEPWSDLYDRIREKLFSHMRPDARLAVTRHFEAFLGDPTNRAIEPTLIHGDFGTSNVLHDPATKSITGVIDFDNAGLGDPAVDFAAARCFGLQRLSKIYPEIQTTLGRVRFYVGTFALQEALFGLENRDAEAFRRGIAPYV